MDFQDDIITGFEELPPPPPKLTPLRIVGRVAIVFFTVIVVLFATVYFSAAMICGDTSPSARQVFVPTLLESGQLKFVVSWFLSPEQIDEIVNANAMSEFNGEIDSSLIVIDGSSSHESGQEGESSEVGTKAGIEIVPVSGRTFYGTMMIVKDPSRVSLTTLKEFGTYGVPLEDLVKDAGALGGINGGIYKSEGNKGGWPYGVVVSNGEIRRNEPNEWPGLVLIGLDENNILQIFDIEGKTQSDMEKLIRDKKIRDAVSFQEEASDANNHFVQLLINGEARVVTGLGSGLNPRTAIGQCADGSLLLFVTDGRGANGHLGASAADLISVMQEFGAVNAANLDGGSSSCMYYGDEYLMTSVTFYYSNASWRLPFAFVVK